MSLRRQSLAPYILAWFVEVLCQHLAICRHSPEALSISVNYTTDAHHDAVLLVEQVERDTITDVEKHLEDCLLWNEVLSTHVANHSQFTIRFGTAAIYCGASN